jgi:hypothetical protein
MNYYFWKWSNGETYCKSPLQTRTFDILPNMTNDIDNNYNSTTNFGYCVRSQTDAMSQQQTLTNAIQQSLYQEEFSNSDINISKREELDTKLSNRELVFQRGTNPFSTNSYVDDVIARDIYLKPINTTQGKITET